jgi:hypothetical protein
VLAEETLALAVVREVIAKFITDDLADQSRAAEGAGDTGWRSAAADGLGVLVIFADEARDTGDPPVKGGTDDFEFTVFADFDLAVGFRVGPDLVGNDFFGDHTFDPAGKELVLGATGPFTFVLFLVCFFALLRLAVFGGGLGFSQYTFVEVEVLLGGVVAFGFAPVKLLPIVFVELEGGGETFFELGDALFQGRDFFQ